MGSEPRLNIKLKPGWTPVKNVNAYMCFRETSANPGELQFSSAVHKPDKPIVKIPTEKGLIDMCRGMARDVRGGREISSLAGKCDFGSFGTVAVFGESPARFQVWVLSNGQDFILVTHTCAKAPDPSEVKEANEIALMTRLE
jgi:hypothetical protein